MNTDPSSLEIDLQHLRAAALDEALLERLESCAAGTWTQLSSDEIAFENRLRAIAPSGLSSALSQSLESIVNTVSFPGEGTIIPFPTRESSAPRHNRRWWAAAAAVALTGALTALMIPDNQISTHQPVAANRPPGVSHPLPQSDALIPAGFNRDLRETHDEGVVWKSNNEAHRVLRVVYMDRVTLKSPDGRTYQVEQPRIEYILMPEQAD
jgi:hypothetical protein